MKQVILSFVAIAFAFSSNAQFEENINLLTNWQDPDAPVLAEWWIASKYNDIWAETINGREFAITGGGLGIYIVELKDDNSAELVQFIPAAYQGSDAVHRDYHTYNGYLYAVCDEGAGQSTLQIIDISGLPETAEVVYDSMDLLTRSHNIFIDTTHAVLYAAGTTLPLGQPSNVRVMSLADPENPTLLYDYTDGYAHDIYVRDNIGYLNSESNMKIVEFNEAGYTILGSITSYPEQGYNHSGWLSEDGNYYAMCDETHGTRIKLLDVSDPTDIQVVSIFGSDISNNSIVHNVLIRDQYVFASYYYDGLQIFDISNPEDVVKVGQYDTYLEPNNSSYKGVWGVYPHLESERVLASDMQTGLYVFDVDLRPAANFNYTLNDYGEINLTDDSNWAPTNWNWIVDGVAIGSGESFDYTFDESGSYEVCISAENDQGVDTSCETIEVAVLVGVADEIENNTLNVVFENKNTLSINYNLDKEQVVTYSIQDLSGKTLFTQEFTEQAGEILRNIDISNSASSGLIIVTLQTENAVWSKKISNQ